MCINLNENTWRLIDIIVGAMLGIGISIAIKWNEDRMEKNKSHFLLKTELTAIEKEISIWSSTPDVIPLQQIPHLKVSAQESRLAKMNEDVAKEAYQLEYALNKAEESRKIAAELRGQPHTSEFLAYS
ncbi:MAG: hypothetical protein PHC43_05550 [Candidatus Marinimicrobia bacterium]|nr:hypothetical protein [Candidatus Neomarinimicrobiota bacterium]